MIEITVCDSSPIELSDVPEVVSDGNRNAAHICLSTKLIEKPNLLKGLYLLWGQLKWFEAGIANLKTVDCFLGDTSPLKILIGFAVFAEIFVVLLNDVV